MDEKTDNYILQTWIFESAQNNIVNRYLKEKDNDEHNRSFDLKNSIKYSVDIGNIKYILLAKYKPENRFDLKR